MFVVSIPLEQGNVFRQQQHVNRLRGCLVSIPLEQGNVFRPGGPDKTGVETLSQSLWNRAMSFDWYLHERWCRSCVSIPLEQGNVFRQNKLSIRDHQGKSQSLWNRAMSFDCLCLILNVYQTSQSLWNRAMSFDLIEAIKKKELKGLNPFGTGQCLSTAVGCSSLVWQGFPEPLPNFFWCLNSWVLIWLNIEQFLSFLFFQNSAKSAVYFSRVCEILQ